jgi:hypothetical protein
LGGRRSAKRVNPVWPNGRLERPFIPARLRGKSLRSLAFRQLRAARDYIMVPYVGGQEQNSETAYAPMAIPKVKVASMMIAWPTSDFTAAPFSLRCHGTPVH